MALLSAASESSSFFGFYREYAQSGVHAAATAGLTLFGLLATYNGAFIVLAIAVYVFPPIYLYLSTDRTDDDPNAAASDATESNRDEPNQRESSAVTSTGDEPTGNGPTSNRPAGDGSATERSAAEEPTTEQSAPERLTSDPTPTGDPKTAGSGTADLGTATVAGDTSPAASADGESRSESASEPRGDTDVPLEWATVASPTDEPLYDAVIAGEVAFATGDNGTVLERRADDWAVALERGPTTEENPLWGIDATDDGERVWFCGDSGALGQYDVAEGRLTDCSAPRDITDSWEDVAVTGPAGSEAIYLVNGSGAVLEGRNDGGDLAWDEPETPGSGSSLSTIAFLDRETGYCCDTNQGVFETTNGGDSWERVGIDDAGVDFNDIAISPDELLIAGGDGSVFRYDDPGWTKLYVGEETLFALDRIGDERNESDGPRDDVGDPASALAVGDNGAIYELLSNDFERLDSPTDETLCGVVRGSDSPDVAVGDDGTILERGN